MDGNRFDDLSRRLATGLSRRTAVKAVAAGLLGALGLRTAAKAQVSQAFCGNVTCPTDPAVCAAGCVCCRYGNGNSRCRPPGACGSGTAVCPPDRPVLDPELGCVENSIPAACTTGTDALSGAPWVVCRADASTAWISHTGNGGFYRPVAICQSLGYAGYDLFGGTCGNVCGACGELDTSCTNLGTESYIGTDFCTPAGGDELCFVVTWRCVA